MSDLDEAEVLDASRVIARQVLDGEVHPYKGALSIYVLVRENESAGFEQLRGFIGASDEWTEEPELRSEIEADIRDLCRRLIG